jgi:hypothetical protein
VTGTTAEAVVLEDCWHAATLEKLVQEKSYSPCSEGYSRVRPLRGPKSTG